MTALMISLLAGATPDAALLDKLGKRALELEHFAKASRVTVGIVSEKLDSDGKVTKTTAIKIRVGRSATTVDRKLLSFVEDGKDLTESKRAELEAPPKKETAVKSPFHPDEQPKYRFANLAPPTDKPSLMRIGFQPSAEKTAELYMGDATIDPETGDVLAFSLRPSKNPAFVQSLFIEAALDAQTPAGRAMSQLTLKGVAGALFFKDRFRVVTTFTDYEPL